METVGKEDESLEYCYIDTLLAHKLPKEDGERALTDDKMVSLCTEFLTASVDTTVTALQWIMANLVKQPRIQERLLDEINAVVAEEDLQNMLYLKAVVLEGLRRHPPAHFLLSHAAVEETSLDGFRVPAARSVNFSVADISLDEGVWDVQAGEVRGRRGRRRGGPDGEPGRQDDAVRGRQEDLPRAGARAAAPRVLRCEHGAGVRAGRRAGRRRRPRREAGVHRHHGAAAARAGCAPRRLMFGTVHW